MNEFESLDRCAAYSAARDALAAIHCSSRAWPPQLAGQARQAAVHTIITTAEGIGHVHGTPARRRCLRDALGTALEVAASVDIARAMGVDDDQLDSAQRMAGRSVALLGLFFHASTNLVNDD
jgi:hypothetical protein